MILLVNCIADPSARRDFDREVVPHLSRLADAPVSIAHFIGPSPLPGPSGFSHLVINGSELSAAEERPEDGPLIDMIRAFADAGRPILGICFGHQMLARAFGGRCRRAERPEFGWKALELVGHPLFAGIPALVSAHSHYDEVSEAPPGFATIASTDRCAVQAMAADGIYGVQFHPELTFERAERMFAENLASEPGAAANFSRDLVDPADASVGERIFTNFFRGLS